MRRLLIPALFAFSMPALAGDAPKVEVKGKIFAAYGLDLTDGADMYNEFTIDRVYMTLKGNLSDQLSTRITLDAGYEKEQSIELFDAAGTAYEVDVPEDTKIRIFLKYAYLEWKPENSDIKMRFGAAGTPMPGYYDKFWGYRFVSKSFTDQVKLLPTSDLGVHFLGKHNDGLVNWQAALVNGEGYGKPEASAGKTVLARVSIDPVASNEDFGLPITGSVAYGIPGKDEDSEIIYVGAIGADHANIKVWGEFVGQSEGDVSGMGFSGTVMPRIPDVIDIFARVDQWDPNTETDGDSELRIIGGLGHQFHKKVMGAVQVEHVTPEGSDTSELGAYLRMEAKY